MVRAEAYQQGARYQETEGETHKHQPVTRARTYTQQHRIKMIKEKFQEDTRETTLGKGAPPPKGSSCLPAVGTQRLETKEQKRDEGRYKRPNKTINTTTQKVIHKRKSVRKQNITKTHKPGQKGS